MSFFQNVFTNEVIVSLSVDGPSFKLSPNRGRDAHSVIAWELPNYNLSGNDADGNATKDLRIGFADDPGLKHWKYIDFDITTTATSTSAVTTEEIKSALNDSTLFTDLFEVSTLIDTKTQKHRVIIKQKKYSDKMKFYVVNGRAESVLKFNARAGIAELPSIFSKDTVENGFVEESMGNLILLDDSGSNVDQDVIDNAVDAKGNSLGYSYSAVQADWQLLSGRDKNFVFKKQTIDGSNRVTQIIEYRAGSEAGDYAKKTIYTYSGANTSPSNILEIPYVLSGSDLITP